MARYRDSLFQGLTVFQPFQTLIGTLWTKTQIPKAFRRNWIAHSKMQRTTTSGYRLEHRNIG